METNNIINAIINRRSIRKYSGMDIPENHIEQILNSARWSPSGLNNQPWRFAIIKNSEIKNSLSELTKYKRIVQESNTCIAVFYNHPAGYNRDKDIMSIGACVQNMLLAADSLGIGSVWLGEILNQKEKVNSLLDIEMENELMAVVALGYPDDNPKSSRKELKDLTIKNFY